MSRNPCLSSPCGDDQCFHNGSYYICVSVGANRPMCNCSHDDDSRSNEDPCISNPCNGFQCIRNGSRFACNCTNSGTISSDCTIDDESACLPDPCGNVECIRSNSQYSCNCFGSGANGSNCAEDIECPEDDYICENGAVCFTIDEQVACNCSGTGFSGANCSVDVDECVNGGDLCSGNGDCRNSAGGYSCACRDGFTGADCSVVADANILDSQYTEKTQIIAFSFVGCFICLIMCGLSVYFYAARRAARQMGLSQEELETVQHKDTDTVSIRSTSTLDDLTLDDWVHLHYSLDD